jgi:L-ribulose-5-phosphate 4-epimerase
MPKGKNFVIFFPFYIFCRTFAQNYAIMLENLKKSVFEANLDLVRHGLVILTWGNVSAIDRDTNLVVIKPSGVSYDTMTVEDMVVVDLDGNVVEGNLRPSSDTPTHLALYRAFEGIGAVVHTHSTYATAWAQACRAIPSLGTTHADTFHHDVPCTDEMTKEQIERAYEAETGVVIADAFRTINPMHTPAVLVAHHGPFTWGENAGKAVENAVILEEVARMASITVALNPTVEMNEDLVEKHYSRKHGANAYYGQK